MYTVYQNNIHLVPEQNIKITKLQYVKLLHVVEYYY